MTRLVKLLRALLYCARELAGENAYQRHLAMHGLRHSADEWRRFSDERAADAARRPTCC